MMAKTAHQAVVISSGHDWHKLFVQAGRLLLLSVLLGGLVLAYNKLNDPRSFPITKIQAQGTFIHLSEDTLQSVLADVEGGYFEIDVVQLQHKIEAMPWVKHARVRRIWPDTLMVAVDEQRPMAYWQETGLMNPRGELFYPEKSSFPQGLPQLNGPDASNMLLRDLYLRFNEMLGVLQLKVQQIDMDARRSVVVVLNNGIRVVLGGEMMKERLQQFIAVYPKVLSANATAVQQIDMRYTNGFTILYKRVK